MDLKKIDQYEDLIIVGDNLCDLHIVKPIKLANIPDPTNKEIRLALDIVRDNFPLYRKADLNTLADFVTDIFNFDVPRERITKVPTFKKVLFKTVIESVTKRKGKYIVKNKRILK